MARLIILGLTLAYANSVVNCAPPIVAMEMDITPVNMTVYYETLCPGCNDFITQQVYPVWLLTKYWNLMSVNLLPFGNADEKRLGFQWVFDCQHGKNECTGNIVETCLMHYYWSKNVTMALGAITTFQADFFKSSGADWKKSLVKTVAAGVDVATIERCVTGPEGNRLEHDIAVRTGPHQYTPYVIIDGVVDESAPNNLLRAVCKAYKGPKPSVCIE